MTHSTFTPFNTSTVALPRLGELLALQRAISEGDDQTLSTLLAMATDRSKIHALIRTWVGYVRKEAGKGARHGVEHTVLWMLPVVTAPGCALSRQVGALMMDWAATWFAPGQSVSALGAPLDYERAASMSPGDVQRMLETLARVKANCVLMLQKDLFHTEAGTTVWPGLQFLVGTTTRGGQQPELLDEADVDRSRQYDRLIANLQFDAGLQTPPADAYQLGRPATFCDALEEGIRMWLQAVQRYCQVKHWSIDPLGDDSTRLSISLDQVDGLTNDQTNCQLEAMRLRIQGWHMDAAALQRMMERCPWPMQTGQGTWGWSARGAS